MRDHIDRPLIPAEVEEAILHAEAAHSLARDLACALTIEHYIETLRKELSRARQRVSQRERHRLKRSLGGAA